MLKMFKSNSFNLIALDEPHVSYQIPFIGTGCWVLAILLPERTATSINLNLPSALKEVGRCKLCLDAWFLLPQQCHQGQTKHQPRPLFLCNAFGRIFPQNPAIIVVETWSHQAYVGKLAQNEDGSGPFGGTFAHCMSKRGNRFKPHFFYSRWRSNCL